MNLNMVMGKMRWVSLASAGETTMPKMPKQIAINRGTHQRLLLRKAEEGARSFDALFQKLLQ